MAALKVREIMTSQVITLSEHDKIAKAIAIFSLDTITGTPVIDEEYRMIGLISETDILNFIHRLDKLHNLKGFDMWDPDNPECVKAFNIIMEEFNKATVGDLMSRAVLSVSPSTSVKETLDVMMEKDINRVPVLEKGVLVGIVSRSDIITMLHKYIKK